MSLANLRLTTSLLNTVSLNKIPVPFIQTPSRDKKWKSPWPGYSLWVHLLSQNSLKLLPCHWGFSNTQTMNTCPIQTRVYKILDLLLMAQSHGCFLGSTSLSFWIWTEALVYSIGKHLYEEMQITKVSYSHNRESTNISNKYLSNKQMDWTELNG